VEPVPFFHANQLFTIFFEDDLAFTEIRRVLDMLIEDEAFDPKLQERINEYHLELDDACFDVGVAGMNVYIRREEGGAEITDRCSE
jgi:hypothetical protein